MATILVADDNSNIQKMVGLALKDHGIDVVAVGNGEAAVRRIPDVHPDLILADIFMPVKNGYEVCEFVKKDPKYSNIPVILLVGAFDPLDEHEAQRVGADGVLKKPFIPPDPLINMVKSALARAAESKRPVAVFAAQPVLAAVSHSEAAVEQSPPSRPAAVSFGDSERPLAFGSLLETETAETEREAEAYVAPVPHPELSDSRNWGAVPVEEEVEEEEEPQTSWRAHAVPDELLTDAAEQTPERSPYADAVLTEKEDLGASTGIVAAEYASVEAVPVAPSEGLEHDLFAHHEQPQQEASPIEAQAGSHDSAEVTAPEAEHKPTPESEQEPAPEVKDKKDYETVFNPDAFPGLFVEEKPPSPMELAEESLQDSPSAFAELSTGVTEPAPSNAETHWPETQPTEAPIPSKLPSLWEEQVRQAARLIASAWPSAHEASVPSQDQSASWHSEPFASKPFSMEPSYPEPKTAHSDDEAEQTKNSETPSQALESAPACNSWLTQQGQQLFSTGMVSQPAPSVEETEPVSNATSGDPAHELPTPAQESFAHEGYNPSTPIAESAVEAAHSDQVKTRESIAAPAYGPISAVHASLAPAVRPAEPPADSATPSPAAPAPDLEAVVAKVLARMNPEMFQSMTQQLLKPVIEAIVRSELEKKP